MVPVPTELVNMLDLLNAHQVAAKQNDAKVKEYKAGAIALMEQTESKSVFYSGHQPSIDSTGGVSVGDTSCRFKATLVKSDTTKVDEARLAEIIGPDVWEKVTVRKLDMGLVDAAVAQGLISLEQLEECVSTKPRAPWVKITESPVPEDEDDESNPF